MVYLCIVYVYLFLCYIPILSLLFVSSYIISITIKSAIYCGALFLFEFAIPLFWDECNSPPLSSNNFLGECDSPLPYHIFRIIHPYGQIAFAPFQIYLPSFSFLSLVVFIYQVLTLVPICILCGVFHTIKFIIYANNNFYHPVFSILAICFE